MKIVKNSFSFSGHSNQKRRKEMDFISMLLILIHKNRLIFTFLKIIHLMTFTFHCFNIAEPILFTARLSSFHYCIIFLNVGVILLFFITKRVRKRVPFWLIFPSFFFPLITITVFFFWFTTDFFQISSVWFCFLFFEVRYFWLTIALVTYSILI